VGEGQTRTIFVALALLLGAVGSVPAATAAGAPRNGPPAAVRPAFGVYGSNYRPISGDFNGDGYGDIFWYAPGTAPDWLWLGHANGQFTSMPETVSGDYTPVVADFNGDGRADILWSDTDTGDPLWLGNADGTFAHHTVSPPGTNFTALVGDFNGDGHADIFWDCAKLGRDYVSFGDGHLHFTLRNTEQIFGDHRAVVGDFNGDGRDDIFFDSTDPSQANFFALANSDGSFSVHAEDTPATNGVPLALDINGDGRDDLLIYQPGTAADWIWYSGSDGLPMSRRFTAINGSYRPFVGDLNGDGHKDIFWYGPGSEPDHIWLDVAHDIPPPPRGAPAEQWEVGIGIAKVELATIDHSAAYVQTTFDVLSAYDRTTGVPLWSDSLFCLNPDAMKRELDILVVSCDNHIDRDVYIYNPANGSLLAHYHGHFGGCASDSPYYMLEWLVPPGGSTAHVTVVATRTGAVVYRTPITTSMPCALSGDRLMLARDGAPGGAEEFNVATKQLVFDNADHTTVWRFGPAGYIALCDTNDDLVGIGPSGNGAWKTDYSCPGYDSPFSFGRATVDLESGVDVDIVTGKLLGAFSDPPIASNGFGAGDFPSRALAFFEAHAPALGACPGPGSELMFLGPYSVSPWLTAAAPVASLQFSLHAIAVQRAAPTCSRPAIQAYDEHGAIRWTMAAAVVPDLNGPIVNDMAANGGQESTALLGINPSDRALELIDLP
jgi:hypothetical protein